MRDDLQEGVDTQERGGDSADLRIGLAPVADYMNRLMRELQAMTSDSATPGSSGKTPPLIEALSAQVDVQSAGRSDVDKEPPSIDAADHNSVDFAQRLRSQTEESFTDLADFKRVLNSAISAAQSGWQARLDSDLATATKVWNDRIESSMERGAHRASDLVMQSSEDMARQLKETFVARMSEFARKFAEATGKTEQHLTAALTSFDREIERGEKVLAQVSSASTDADDQASRLAALTGTSQQELRRASAMLEWHSQELVRRARQSMATCSDNVQNMIETAAKETVVRLGGEFELELSSDLDRAREILGRLENERLAAEQILGTCQDRIRELSEQAVTAAMARLPKIEDRSESGIGETARTAANVFPKNDLEIIRSGHDEHGQQCASKSDSVPDHPGCLWLKDKDFKATVEKGLLSPSSERERRDDRRLKISRPLLVRPSDPQFKEEVETTLNASRNGLYFTTSVNSYYVGMHLSIILGYAPNDPCNVPSFGEVTRVEPRRGGNWGIGVHILMH